MPQGDKAMPKLRVVTTFFVMLTAVSGAWSAAEAQGSSELAGGWIVTSWTPAEGETNAEPQRGLFVFTETGHYSIMYVLGNEERPQYEGTQTDAETLSAYGSFVANSGRYRVNGDQLTYEAYVAKDPNYMASFGPEAANGTDVRFSIADGTLTLTWLGTGRGAGQIATLRRPGQPAGT